MKPQPRPDPPRTLPSGRPYPTAAQWAAFDAHLVALLASAWQNGARPPSAPRAAGEE